LTQAIAAKIYELGHLQKYEFNLVEGPTADSIKILNHFYVKNVGIARNRNLCLSNYTTITDTRNSIVTYQLKQSSAFDFKTSQRKLFGDKTKEHLDLLLSFRPLYRTDNKEPYKPESAKKRTMEEEDAAVIEVDRFNKTLGLVV